MWKRAGVVVVWVLAAVGTTSITLAAVSQVGGRVVERAATPIDSADIAAARAAALATVTTVTTVTTVPQPADDAASTSTVPWVDVTTSSGPAAAVTTDPDLAAPTTTGPATPPATAASTTTTEPPATTVVFEQVTTVLIGGTVTVQRSGSDVALVSAIPKEGFWTDLESSGPSNVSVEFESETHDSYYEASVVGGELSVTTDEVEDGDKGGDGD